MFTYHLMFNPMLNDSIELNNNSRLTGFFCVFLRFDFIFLDFVAMISCTQLKISMGQTCSRNLIVVLRPLNGITIRANNKTCDFEHVQFIAHDITCED